MNLMGQADAQINKCFHPVGSYFRTGHEEGQSFFEGLDREKQNSLVEYARRETSYAAIVDESDFKNYLEAQYEIEFKAFFSSAKDKTIGLPGDLLKRLIQITKEEKGRTPPEEPPSMKFQIRKVPVLDTLNLQAKRFKAESLCRCSRSRTCGRVARSSKQLRPSA